MDSSKWKSCVQTFKFIELTKNKKIKVKEMKRVNDNS